MRKFIKNTLLFVLLLFFTALFIELKLSLVIDHYERKAKHWANNKANISSVIIGNSHGLYGVDATLLSEKCYNFCFESQSFLYDIKITNKILKESNQIKQIFWTISPYTFFYDLEKSTEIWRVKRYKDAFDIEAQFKTPIHSNFRILQFPAKSIFKQLFNKQSVWENNLLEDGSALLPSSKLDTLNVVHTISKHKQLISYNTHVLNKQIDEIMNVIEICNERNVELVFILMPTTEKYASSFYEFITYNKKIFTFLSQKYKQIRILDYSNHFDVFTLEDFADADHLNLLGKTKLSKLVSKLKCLHQK